MKFFYTFGSVLLFFGFAYVFLPHLVMEDMMMGTVYWTVLGFSLVVGSLAIMISADRQKV